jgi:glucosamine-6-phosphate deaminase
MLSLQVVPDPEALAATAAERIAAVLRAKPDAVVLVATGDTPMRTYACLAELRAAGEVNTNRLRAVQLDEYLGLGEGDNRSLYGWMQRSFLDPLGIPPERTIRLNAAAPSTEESCREFVAAVGAWGGIDIAVLGLGPNGHLGFNEPPSDATSPTREVPLTEESLVSNARYWGGRERVPERALTTGMDLILASREVLLLVSGAGKRDILAATLEAPARPEVPASFLQQARATVIADEAAARG